MINMYNSLPLPILLIISFGSAIVVLNNHFRSSKTYPRAIGYALVLISITAILVGILRIASSLNPDQELENIGAIPVVTMFLGIIFLMVGSIQRTKDDPSKKATVTIA